MNLVAFQSLRNGLKLNTGPATSQVRKVLETGLREELLLSGVFDDIEVGTSDDGDRLVLGLCTYRADLCEDEIASAMQAAWAALAFHNWQAHAFLFADGHVELQAATLDRPNGRYLTVHLVAQRAVAPLAAVADNVGVLPMQRGTNEKMPAAVALAHSA